MLHESVRPPGSEEKLSIHSVEAREFPCFARTADPCIRTSLSVPDAMTEFCQVARRSIGFVISANFESRFETRSDPCCHTRGAYELVLSD